jgi:hypothetical protein
VKPKVFINYFPGAAKAKQLLSQGIKSIEDLRQHEDKLTAGQKIGLHYYEVGGVICPVLA